MRDAITHALALALGMLLMVFLFWAVLPSYGCHVF